MYLCICLSIRLSEKSNKVRGTDRGSFVPFVIGQLYLLTYFYPLRQTHTAASDIYDDSDPDSVYT